MDLQGGSLGRIRVAWEGLRVVVSYFLNYIYLFINVHFSVKNSIISVGQLCFPATVREAPKDWCGKKLFQL